MTRDILRIEKAGTDLCMLTGKEASDGCYVVLDDGSRGFMSWKAIRSYTAMKTAMKNGKSDQGDVDRQEQQPATNGPQSERALP